MADTATLVLPEWTELASKSGLDPLGMQNSGILLYQALLPGISNVTLRVRYYGLYSWLSWIYAQRVGDTNLKSWQRFVRRAEALYALVAYQRGGETGVAGVQWAQTKLTNKNEEVIAFADDAEPGSPTHYLVQAWGAYGAAYASQLFDAGVYSQAKGHDLPVPSREIGEGLACAFDQELGPLAALLFEVIERGSVTRSELDTLKPITPSGIRIDSAERQLYQDMLFAHGELQRPPDIERRHTLLLILRLAEQLNRTPTSNDVRWALYAGADKSDNALTFEAGELEAQRQRWAIYQLNDLTHVCLEALLKYALDTLGEYPAGLTLARLIGIAVDGLLGTQESATENWAALLKATALPANAWSSAETMNESALSERVMQVARAVTLCKASDAWAALQLLAIVHQRARLARDGVSAAFGSLDQSAFRSLYTEMRFLDQHEQLSFRDFVGQLIEERVIRRHMWIALRKFRFQGDYTFLFETDEGVVRVRAKDGPVFTNPRLSPAITFLDDIKLFSGAGLSALGRALTGTA
ncbi:MAG: hypothetical protein DCF16_13810 [Alphaproteobacteria bacterium]|nr:MAG: hypothetical protein DCF16_13810 [Alphaproteobacteria bacterium]